MSRSSNDGAQAVRNFPRLTQWRVRNFKSIEAAQVDLAGLTVLVGANSAGKSSLIQSILLFVQAQDARQERPDNFPLNGQRVRLGSFDEVLFAGSRAAQVELGGTVTRDALFDPEQSADRAESRIGADSFSWAVSWDTSFFPPRDGDGGQMRFLRSVLSMDEKGRPSSGEGTPTRHVEVSLERSATRRRKWTGDPLLVFLTRNRDLDARARDLVSGLTREFKGRLVTTWPSPCAVRVAAGVPDRGLPHIMLRRSRLSTAMATPFMHGRGTFANDSEGEIHMIIVNAITEAFRSQHPPLEGKEAWEEYIEDILKDVLDLLKQYDDFDERHSGPNLTPAALAVAGEIREKFATLSIGVAGRDEEARALAWIRRRLDSRDLQVLTEFPEQDEAARAVQRVRTFLAGRVRYLGPLRTTPRTLPGAYAPEYGVGTEGEFTASVLRASMDQRVTHCRLGSDEPVEEALGEAVDYWLDAINLGRGVTTQDRDRYGTETLIRPYDIDRELNLRNVGVGVSQVLPVIVLSLLADPGSLLLFEQPELHLHPSSQQALGDFLIAMMRSGRQIIIETHSDHLVTRLRRRIAEDTAADNRLVDNVGFVFAERKGGISHYRQVQPNEFGGIYDWPVGFMDQGASESAQLVEAALRKQETGSSA